MDRTIVVRCKTWADCLVSTMKTLSLLITTLYKFDASRESLLYSNMQICKELFLPRLIKSRQIRLSVFHIESIISIIITYIYMDISMYHYMIWIWLNTYIFTYLNSYVHTYIIYLQVLTTSVTFLYDSGASSMTSLGEATLMLIPFSLRDSNTCSKPIFLLDLARDNARPWNKFTRLLAGLVRYVKPVTPVPIFDFTCLWCHLI